MLKQFQVGRWTMVMSSPPILPFYPKPTASEYSDCTIFTTYSNSKSLNNNNKIFIGQVRALTARCAARRRALRYDDEDEDDEDEEYGHNEEIAALELYSQSVRGEALIVHAVVDDQDVQVLIFKGFSSCLSYRTSPDPSKSVLPARAVIKSIDRVKGPFDPSNIEYLQKDITWEAFSSNINIPPHLQI